jgi:hypothetical protein
MEPPEEREKRVQRTTVLVVLLILLFAVVIVNSLIYRQVGGTELITTFQADADWGLVALGVYLVVFELEKRPPRQPAQVVT